MNGSSKKEKSILRIYEKIGKYMKLTNIFLTLLLLSSFFLLIYITIANITEDSKALIMNFKNRLTEIRISMRNSKFTLKLNEHGIVVKAFPKFLNGFDMSRSYIFQKIRSMKPKDVNVLIYPDIFTGKLKVYFVLKDPNGYSIAIFDMKKFFPSKIGMRDLLILDENRICVFSTDPTFIGEMISPKLFKFMGFKLLLIKRIQIQELGSLDLYLIYNISPQFYFILVAFLTGLSILTLNFIYYRNLRGNIRNVDLEHRKLIEIVGKLPNIVEAGFKRKDVYSEKPNIDVINVTLLALKDFLHEIEDESQEFKESKEYMNVVKDLVRYIIDLFEDVLTNAKRIAEFNERIQKMYKELERSNIYLKSTSMKLERMIRMITIINPTEISVEEFLKHIFRLSIEFVDEARNGFAFIVKNGVWDIIDSVGIEDKEFSKLIIRSDYIMKNMDMVVMNFGKFRKKLPISDEEKERFFSIIGRSRQLLISNFRAGKKIVGSIILGIPEDSKEEFKDESLKVIRALNNLVSVFLLLKDYMKMQGKFQKEMILSLIKILEIHDPYTKGHSEFVAEYSAKLAEELGMDKESIKKIYWAGLLHDVGKVLISPSILNKPGKLTLEEFEEIKKHPTYGYEILKTSDVLKDIAEIVHFHHERIDGSGYPKGLKGNEIPMGAKIIAVVDSFNAMTSDRPYRSAMPVDTALKELIKGANKLYDPRIVRTFIYLIVKLEKMA